MDESKLWELAQILERTVTRQEHIAKLLDHLQARVETIEKHDDLQEERMAQMQETVTSLAESVQKVEAASMRLRHGRLHTFLVPLQSNILKALVPRQTALLQGTPEIDILVTGHL